MKVGDNLEAIVDVKGCLGGGLGYLPGGHLPPPKFGHLPPPNSDISHPQKKTFARRTAATPNFSFFLFFLFWRIFLAFSTYSSWRTSRMGRRRCLTRWSWSTSSRRCVREPVKNVLADFAR